MGSGSHSHSKFCEVHQGRAQGWAFHTPCTRPWWLRSFLNYAKQQRRASCLNRFFARIARETSLPYANRNWRLSQSFPWTAGIVMKFVVVGSRLDTPLTYLGSTHRLEIVQPNLRPRPLAFCYHHFVLPELQIGGLSLPEVSCTSSPVCWARRSPRTGLGGGWTSDDFFRFCCEIF